MEKIHIERHEAEYRIDGLTLTKGGCLFHLRQLKGERRDFLLLPVIRSKRPLSPVAEEVIYFIPAFYDV